MDATPGSGTQVKMDAELTRPGGASPDVSQTEVTYPVREERKLGGGPRQQAKVKNCMDTMAERNHLHPQPLRAVSNAIR